MDIKYKYRHTCTVKLCDVLTVKHALCVLCEFAVVARKQFVIETDCVYSEVGWGRRNC